MSTLTAEEIARYSRHLILDEVGMEGQQTLKDSRVLCIGTGGLGSPLLMYLAAAGVGRRARNLHLREAPRRLLLFLLRLARLALRRDAARERLGAPGLVFCARETEPLAAGSSHRRGRCSVGGRRSDGCRRRRVDFEGPRD